MCACKEIGDGGLFRGQVAPTFLGFLVFLRPLLTTPNYIGHTNFFPAASILSSSGENHLGHMSDILLSLSIFLAEQCLPHRLSSSFLSGGVWRRRKVFPLGRRLFGPENGFLMTGRNMLRVYAGFKNFSSTVFCVELEREGSRSHDLNQIQLETLPNQKEKKTKNRIQSWRNEKICIC